VLCHFMFYLLRRLSRVATGEYLAQITHEIVSVPTPEMSETSLLPGEEKVVVMWSRAAVQIRCAHEDGPEDSLPRY
jgi:hypothetical protein